MNHLFELLWLPALNVHQDTIHVRVYWDNITEDYCADTNEVPGLTVWAPTPEEARRKLIVNLMRYRRYARELKEYEIRATTGKE